MDPLKDAATHGPDGDLAALYYVLYICPSGTYHTPNLYPEGGTPLRKDSSLGVEETFLNPKRLLGD